MEYAITIIPFMASNDCLNPNQRDYDILGLFKQKIFTNGELLEVKYRKNYDGTTYSDLAVHETRVYNRDGYGLPTTRETHIIWYLEDGSIGMEKDTVKYYTLQEGYAENITRRQNLIDNGSMYLLSQVGVSNAQAFSAIINTERSLYIAGSMQPLLDAIAASTESYMTQTIKDTLIVILTII